jgi:lactoylglutathione lyase
MHFCWVTINVKDMEESLSFYRDIVGLPVNRKMKPRPGMEIIFLGSDGVEVELIKDEEGSNPFFGDDISLGFTVDSVDKTIEFLASKNIPIDSGPFQPNPMTKFFYVLDPNGLQVQFVENLSK